MPDEIKRNQSYGEFTGKFEPKRTTDDCMTPPAVYDAVLAWTVREYGVDPGNVVRPFWPGADYTAAEYPEGCAVVDNPPFSILAAVCRWFDERGVKYFLFAPFLTLMGVRADCCKIPNACDVTYTNGAQVRTGFVTNLDQRFAVRSCPDLKREVDAAARLTAVEKVRGSHVQTSKLRYEYPPDVLTASKVGHLARYGVAFDVPRDRAARIPALDAQRAVHKKAFGGAYLLGIDEARALELAEREAAAEKARRASLDGAGDVVVWELSPRERLEQAALTYPELS